MGELTEKKLLILGALMGAGCVSTIVIRQRCGHPNEGGWAYAPLLALKKAGLVKNLRYGEYEITPAGRALLESPPQ